MGKAVVTGAAGFIGSHLAERLVADGLDVVGIDCFTDYYDVRAKRRNLEALRRTPAFSLYDLDLRTADLRSALAEADYVVHLAAQPGVRASWGDGLRSYMDHNVSGLGNLFEHCRTLPLTRIVVASSSSVYGDAGSGPVPECQPPAPVSPYGLSKAAAEKLSDIYATAFDLPVAILRYFSVFGPRQRPDMLIARLIQSTLGGPAVPVYGDGNGARSFTYVADVVDATIAAMMSPLPCGSVFNVSSDSPSTIMEAAAAVTSAMGRQPTLKRHDAVPGDVHNSWGNSEAAAALLGWRPQTSLEDGVAEQVAWAIGLAPGTTWTTPRLLRP